MTSKIFSYAKDALIIILFVWLTFRGGKSVNPGVPTIDTVITVVHHYHDSTITTTLQPTNVTVTKLIPTKYIPDSTYEGLKKQYMDRLDSFLATVTYSDTLKIDSIGYVRIQDTVSMNRNIGRSYNYKIDQPEKVTTITIREPYKPKNQFYLGGGTGITTQGSIDQLNLGLMFKNKRDRVIGLSGGYNFPLKAPQINLSFYTKLKL